MGIILTAIAFVLIIIVVDKNSYKCGFADAKKKYNKPCPIQTKVICAAGTCETTVDHCTYCKRTSEPKMNC